jgi:hypothetical protein
MQSHLPLKQANKSFSFPNSDRWHFPNNIRHSAILGVLFTSCISCQNLTLTEHQKAHIISVNSRSLAEEQGSRKNTINLEDSNLQVKIDIDELGREFRKSRSKTKEILIFVHGGLISTNTGIESAVNKIERLKQRPDIFPVLVTWNSGFLSSLTQHLIYEVNGINYSLKGWHFKTFGLGPIIAPYNLVTDLAGGIAEAPRTTVNAFTKTSQNWDPAYNAWPDAFPSRQRYRHEIEKISPDNANPESNGFTVFSGNTTRFPIQLGTEYKTGVSAAIGASHIVSAPIKIGLSPIYEGLGRPAWQNMQRRASTLVHWSPSFITPSNGYKEKNDNRTDGVFCQVLKEIAQWKKANPGVKVTVAGHSMGTIVLNEAIREINAGNIELKIDKIIYMAAACSLRDFSQGAGAYIEKNKHCKAYNLCLHPKREISEYQPFRYIPACYAGSLLVWIDEFFESPRDFLGRSAGSFENCIAARHHLPQTKQFHLKAFESDPSSTNTPQRHGDFDDFPFWEESFHSISASP